MVITGSTHYRPRSRWFLPFLLGTGFGSCSSSVLCVIIWFVVGKGGPDLATKNVSGGKAVDVELMKLCEEYDANEVAASAKYEGQTVRFTSELQDIMGDKKAARLKFRGWNDAGRFLYIFSVVSPQEAAKLHTGDMITVEGTLGKMKTSGFGANVEFSIDIEVR